MAKRSSKPLGSAQAKNVKHGLAVLKKKGLYSGDARKAPTEYGIRLTRKFADVIAGKASVVTAKGRKRGGVITTARNEARAFERSGLKVKGTKIIVPKDGKENYRFDEKTGWLEATETIRGRKVRKVISRRGLQDRKVIEARAQGKIAFNIPLVPYNAPETIKWQRYFDFDELESDMQAFYPRFMDYRDYIVMEYVR